MLRNMRLDVNEKAARKVAPMKAIPSVVKRQSDFDLRNCYVLAPETTVDKVQILYHIQADEIFLQANVCK